MKLWEAMKAMEEGKKIRKTDWDEYQYIQLNNNNCVINEAGLFSYFNLTHVNDEWEIYEEKKEVDPRFKELYDYLKNENGFANGQYSEFIQNNNLEDHLLKFYMQLLEMAKYYKLN